MKKVLVTGTFDSLHPGHLDLFQQAKTKGGFLIVVIARDKTVRAVKGHRPRNNEQQRLTAVQNLPIVDKAVLGHHADKLKIIVEEQPDIICLGYDQQAFTEHLAAELKKRGLITPVIRLKAFQPGQYKSSILDGR